MRDLFEVLKWYLVASLVSALYGVVISFDYIAETMTQRQDQYLGLGANIIIAVLYLVAIFKTFGALKSLPNKSIQPNAKASAD